MNYTSYRAEDFAAHSSFRQWVRQPDAASDAFWQNFLTENPHKRDTVDEAIELVKALTAATDALTPPASEAEQRATWHAIKTRITQPPSVVTNPFLGRTHGTGSWRWLAAASILAILGLGWWQYASRGYPELSLAQSSAAGQPTAPIMVERTNTGNVPLLVLLPDGSSLLLYKGSTVRFLARNTDSSRVVALTGEAFFEVVKDPAHPFLVRTDRFVAKVLGTSFMVRDYAADQDAAITVRTGRVAVFAPSDLRQQQQRNSPILNGQLVLSKNQQVVFVGHRTGTLGYLPLKPKELTPASTHEVFSSIPDQFAFTDAPVSEVFAQLETMYGVQIHYNHETLGACRLTADLTDEPLLEKMLIICKSIEANYTIDGTKLTVKGSGCQY